MSRFVNAKSASVSSSASAVDTCSFALKWRYPSSGTAIESFGAGVGGVDESADGPVGCVLVGSCVGGPGGSCVGGCMSAMFLLVGVRVVYVWTEGVGVRVWNGEIFACSLDVYVCTNRARRIGGVPGIVFVAIFYLHA